LPVGKYRLGIVLLSDDRQSEQTLRSVELSSDADIDNCASNKTQNVTFSKCLKNVHCGC